MLIPCSVFYEIAKIMFSEIKFSGICKIEVVLKIVRYLYVKTVHTAILKKVAPVIRDA